MGAMPRKDYVKPRAVSKITLLTAIVGDTVTVNGNVYTGVAGVKADDTEFSIDTSNTAAAADLADSIDGDVRVGTIAGVTISATSTGESVTVVGVGADASNVEVLSSDPATVKLSSASLNADGLTSTPDDNNGVLKRVNHMNAPSSIQASGADNFGYEANKADDRVEEITTETEFNTLTTRQRVLFGNKEGWIKTVTASTSIVIAYLDEVKAEQTITLTMAQVIANSPQSIFILNEPTA